MGLIAFFKTLLFPLNPDVLSLSADDYQRRLDGLADEMFGCDYASCSREQRLTVQSYMQLGNRPQSKDAYAEGEPE